MMELSRSQRKGLCTVIPDEQKVPFVQSIFHLSDFSQASQLAFAHALRR